VIAGREVATQGRARGRAEVQRDAAGPRGERDLGAAQRQLEGHGA
jgi:hypothetical protein